MKRDATSYRLDESLFHSIYGVWSNGFLPAWKSGEVKPLDYAYPLSGSTHCSTSRNASDTRIERSISDNP
jgi:hypothetical protein